MLKQKEILLMCAVFTLMAANACFAEALWGIVNERMLRFWRGFGTAMAIGTFLFMVYALVFLREEADQHG